VKSLGSVTSGVSFLPLAQSDGRPNLDRRREFSVHARGLLVDLPFMFDGAVSLRTCIWRDITALAVTLLLPSGFSS